MKKRQETKLEKEIKKVKKDKKKEMFVVFLAIVSIIGFAVSLFFLVSITGAAIGGGRSNLYGLIFIVISLLMWTVAELIWIKNKKKEEIDIKKLLKDLEREGFPMVYSKYLKKSG